MFCYKKQQLLKSIYTQKRFFRVVFFIYTLFLLVAVFFTPERLNSYPIMVKPNFIPFNNILYQFLYSPDYIPPGHTESLILNIIGNLLLFVPMSFFISLINDINKKKIFLICFLISMLIETIQGIFHLGVFDIDDLILNSISTCMGIFLFGKMKNKYL